MSPSSLARVSGVQSVLGPHSPRLATFPDPTRPADAPSISTAQWSRGFTAAMTEGSANPTGAKTGVGRNGVTYKRTLGKGQTNV